MGKKINQQIEIYKSNSGQAQVEVLFKEDTVWLSQEQIVKLFERDQSVISRHINNVFKEGELDKKSNMHKMHIANSDKPVIVYNLDVIISVGYRVKSLRGTQFRQWATNRLKEYLIEGYSINQNRLKERELELQYLKSGISILRRSIEQQAHSMDDAKKLTALLDGFSNGLSLLDDYDHESLDKTGKTTRPAVRIHLAEFMNLIQAMRSDFSSALFGKAKDASFESSVAQIYQFFGGSDVYPSIEEKAAMLLYLVVKNHSFVDGNKRIAAACFLYFLEKNGLLYNNTGETLISNDALAAITLFIAESRPEEMATVKQVLLSILNRKED